MVGGGGAGSGASLSLVASIKKPTAATPSIMRPAQSLASEVRTTSWLVVGGSLESIQSAATSTSPYAEGSAVGLSVGLSSSIGLMTSMNGASVSIGIDVCFLVVRVIFDGSLAKKYCADNIRAVHA